MGWRKCTFQPFSLLPIDVDEPIVENQSDMEEVFEDVEIKEEKPKAKRKGRPKKSKAKLDAEESITG